MRRALLLPVLLLLPIAGCGGEERGTVDADETPSATPAENWAQVREDLKGLDRLSYRVESDLVSLEQPLKVQTGAVDLAAGTSTNRMVMELEGDRFVTDVRVVGDEMFLQMQDWGPLDGCWMSWSSEQMLGISGMDLSDRRPPWLVALLGADLVEEESDQEALALEVDAEYALQLLGVGARALSDIPGGTLRTQVPAELALDDEGHATSFELRGRQVARVLVEQHGQSLGEQAREVVPGMSSSTTWKPVAEPLDVTRPTAGQLITDANDQPEPCSDPED